jgi:hypothetical protein
MKKLLGYVFVLGSLLCLGNFFFGTASRQDKEILARQSDYGGVSALTPNPRSIFLYAGVALGAIGGALLKHS